MKMVFKVMAMTVLAACLPLQDARAEAVYLLDFKQMDKSPAGQARALLDRFANAADWAVPKDQAVPPIPCKTEFKPDAKERFATTLEKNGELCLTIGGNPETLASDAETLHKLMKTLLLARCGLQPQPQDGKFPEWIASGLARKVLSDNIMPNTPGGAGAPTAYVLASLGKYPTLCTVLQSPLLPEDGECYLLNSEYAQFLITLSARSGLVQGGVLRSMILEVAKNPKADPYDTFVKAARKFIKGNRKNSKGEEEELQEWFASNLRRSVASRFVPVPAKRCEELCKEALKIDYKDLDKKPQTCDFNELKGKWDSVLNKVEVAGRIKAKIAEIANCAPDALQQPLWKMQESLDTLPTAKAQDSVFDKLERAVAEFNAGIEERKREEARIKASERKIVPPGVRFGETIDAISAYDAWEEAPYEKEAAYLDSWLAKR